MSQLKKVKIFHSFAECDKEVQRLKLLQQQYPLCRDVIPPELSDLDQWVVWSYEVREWENGLFGPVKIPYQTKNPNRKASRTISSDWSDLETALWCVENNWSSVDGIGFVFSREDGLSGVDFDNCRNPETEYVREEYQFWIDKLEGYAEISPSGTGIKVWVKGTIAEQYFKAEESTGFRILKFAGGEIEVYRRGQYFTVTTRSLKKVESITSAQRELDVLSEWSLSEVNRDLSDNWSSGPRLTGEDTEDELSLLENGDETNVEDIVELDMQPTSSTYPPGPVDIHTPSTQKATTPNRLELQCPQCGETYEPHRLCHECYEVSPDREPEVEKAVYDYFSELKVNGFSPYRQNNFDGRTICKIQFGSQSGYADVVLADQNGSFAAIAECKGAGYTGDGMEQLKSYLSATDTRFGVFANSKESSQWKFYENQRRNCVPEIGRSEFEIGVVERINRRALLVDEIEELKGQASEIQGHYESLKHQKANMSREVENLETEVNNLRNNRKRLESDISDLRLQFEQIKPKIDEQTKKHSDLEKEIRQLNQVESKLGMQVQSKQAQFDKLVSEIENREQMRSKLKREIEPLEQLKEESYELRLRIKERMRSARDWQTKCEKLEAENKRLDNQKSGLETEVTELEENKHNITTIYDQLKIETDQLGNQKSGLEIKVRELKQTEKDMHTACGQLEGEINQLEERLFRLKRKIQIKHVLAAFTPAAVVTVTGAVVSVFSGALDAIIALIVLFVTIFITGLALEKIFLTEKDIVNWLKNLFSKENE